MPAQIDRNNRIISEYEDLVKIKKFHHEGDVQPLKWTWQSVYKALEQGYTHNIRDKLNRWIEITNARYFQYAPPIFVYFQTKMLYRDGYYEAAIMLARSTCEMICYDFLGRQAHPFGPEAEVEKKFFTTLVGFLGIPHSIPKSVFEKEIVPKLTELKEANFVKSSYTFDKPQKTYLFKQEIGKAPENIKRLHTYLDKTGYREKGIFPGNTFQIISDVYNLGSDYIHARKSNNTPKQDAYDCTNRIGMVLAHLYNVDGSLVGKTIVTGYDLFSDVSRGISLSPDVYFTPEAAERGYYHMPSPEQYAKMFSLAGDWQGEWKDSGSENRYAMLSFSVESETLYAKFLPSGSDTNAETVDIELFDNYFHLTGFPKGATSSRSYLFKFEIEIFNPIVLLGHNLMDGGNVMFTKIIP